MNRKTDRKFVFTTAVRQQVSLIIAMVGASSSGKTLSALKLARGLADGDDSRIGVIDTESGRASHYAPPPGEKPAADRFAFQSVDLAPPFTPEAYIDAILAADESGFAVIVVDSASHEWDGEGGLQDIHDDLVAHAVERDRANAEAKGWNFNEAMAADKASIGAWRDPKSRHRKFISRLLQCRAHLILCFRADEKMRMEQVEDDKGRKRTVIVQPKDLPLSERWVPICEKRLPYEMTLSLLLTPSAPGVPIPLKLQTQHAHAFPENTRISEETGRLLGEWAKGVKSAVDDTASRAEAAARAGTAAFRKFWTTLSAGDRNRLKPRLAEFRSLAEIGDAPDDPFADRKDGAEAGHEDEGDNSARAAEAPVDQAPAAKAGTGEDARPEPDTGQDTVKPPAGDAALLADLMATGKERAEQGRAVLEHWLDDDLSSREQALMTPARVRELMDHAASHSKKGGRK